MFGRLTDTLKMVIWIGENRTEHWKIRIVNLFCKTQIYSDIWNIYHHLGLDNCATKNSRKAVHFYALYVKMYNFLISV